MSLVERYDQLSDTERELAALHAALPVGQLAASQIAQLDRELFGSWGNRLDEEIECEMRDLGSEVA